MSKSKSVYKTEKKLPTARMACMSGYTSGIRSPSSSRRGSCSCSRSVGIPPVEQASTPRPTDDSPIWLPKLSTSLPRHPPPQATTHPRRCPSQRVAPSVPVSSLVVSQLTVAAATVRERRFLNLASPLTPNSTDAGINNHRRYHVCRPCPIEASVVIVPSSAERVTRRLTHIYGL